MHQPALTARPCPVGNLVDRAIQTRAAGLLHDQARGGGGEGGEPADELVRPDVQRRGHAVMAEIPDDLHSRALRRLQHRQEARPVVDVRLALDQVPAQGVARGAQAAGGEDPVVVIGVAIVARGRDQVEPPAARQGMARGFEAAAVERLQQRGTPDAERAVDLDRAQMGYRRDDGLARPAALEQLALAHRHRMHHRRPGAVP